MLQTTYAVSLQPAAIKISNAILCDKLHLYRCHVGLVFLPIVPIIGNFEQNLLE